MTAKFVIEDQRHAETISEHATLAEARHELEHLAQTRWDQPPNLAPCGSWQTCGREYEIVEYETGAHPWKVVSRAGGLEISAEGLVWNWKESRGAS